ncbi:hypothetical protein C7387_0630 [Yokenella regensburgei]|uniref:50S ribosomal protein L15 n=1 Tax=Yokenella regensburgei TaxID=158877 RepID=A0ABX9RZY5_9ENTR|nr:hypothetical protein C7387_0630 [Yokenella regensburgei]VFS24744.1 Uncharacterised protein [Yokenella regensburgei]
MAKEYHKKPAQQPKLAEISLRTYPIRRNRRRQFGHGQRGKTGAYTKYVRILSTAQVQTDKQDSLKGRFLDLEPKTLDHRRIWLTIITA